MKAKYIDLFSGIGAFRLALDPYFDCVFSSEINDHACEMYEANFGINPKSDITKINASDLPDFDILCAGFPCQAFSIAGEKKGFSDTRGTLFFDIARIVNEKKPKTIILENVEHLINHDKGNTFKVIIGTLENMGYKTSFSVLNAKDFNVPQSRKRIVIIGDKEKKFDFSKIKTYKPISINDCLDKDKNHDWLEKDTYTLIEKPKTQKSGLRFVGYLNKNIRQNGVREGTMHLSRTHRQCNRIYCSTGVHPTISSQESAGRYYVLVDGGVRKLSIKEVYRLMGFDDGFIKIGAKSKQYERVGNSVCVNMLREIAKQVKEQLF